MLYKRITPTSGCVVESYQIAFFVLLAFLMRKGRGHGAVAYIEPVGTKEGLFIPKVLLEYDTMRIGWKLS